MARDALYTLSGSPCWSSQLLHMNTRMSMKQPPLLVSVYFALRPAPAHPPPLRLELVHTSRGGAPLPQHDTWPACVERVFIFYVHNLSCSWERALKHSCLGPGSGGRKSADKDRIVERCGFQPFSCCRSQPFQLHRQLRAVSCCGFRPDPACRQKH